MPGQRDRDDEQGGEDQIGREHPFRQSQILRLDVFHHRDVELARQTNDGHHGHAGLHHHRRPIDGLFPVLLQARCEHGLIEQIVEAVIQAEGHERANGEKREQLDQRLERNGQYHAPVVFGGVEVAGAEDDGK